MLDIQFITPEIQEKSIQKDGLVLVANIPQTVKLFQGQRLKVKTGVAIKTDNHAMAVPLRDNNEIGLILASGFELVSDKDGEIEILIWNRNPQGSPRMIEITPMMPVASLVFMPSVMPSLPGVKQEETEIQPETEKSLEELSIKDLRNIIDGMNDGLDDDEVLVYLQKSTKTELINLIRSQGDNG